MRLRALGNGDGIRVLAAGGDRLLVAIARSAEIGSAAGTTSREVLRAMEMGVEENLSGVELLEHAGASLGPSPVPSEFSVALLDVDLRRGRVHTTSAGERLGLLVDGDGRVTSLGPPSAPLGRAGWAPSQRDLPYRPGSRLVLFADCPEGDPNLDGPCERVSQALGSRVDPLLVDQMVAESVADGADPRGHRTLIVILEHGRTS